MGGADAWSNAAHDPVSSVAYMVSHIVTVLKCLQKKLCPHMFIGNVRRQIQRWQLPIVSQFGPFVTRRPRLDFPVVVAQAHNAGATTIA